MTPSPDKTLPQNAQGRDLAVGDIHGHFALLQQALDTLDFDPARDRLFSVGDLADRGPECSEVIHWLARPWFHPVCGNHDDYVCRYELRSGELDPKRRRLVSAPDPCRAGGVRRPLPQPAPGHRGGHPGRPGRAASRRLPFSSWQGLLDQLDAGVSGGRLRAIKNVCLWSRRRIERLDEGGVADLAALVVGHTPVRVPVRLGNVHYIDTGGWYPEEGGYFTLLDLNTLTLTFPCPEPDRWDDQAHGQRPLPIKAPGERPGLRSASAMVYHAGNCGAWHPTQAPGAAVIGYSFRAT